MPICFVCINSVCCGVGMELDILCALAERDSYERYAKYIKEHALSKECFTILKDMGEHFKTNEEETEIEWGSFRTEFFLKYHPSIDDDAGDVYSRILTLLEEHSTEEGIEEALSFLFLRATAEDLIAEAETLAERGGKVEDLNKLSSIIDKCKEDLGSTLDVDSMFVSDSLEELLVATDRKGGMQWRLPVLNDAIGAVTVGDLIVVSSRPDGGKTTFLCSEATCMAEQMPTDKHVLWFNNEEGGAKVKVRLFCAALGVPRDTLDASPVASQKAYNDLMGRPDKIKFYDKPALSTHDIEDALRAYPAGLIIIDQLWKVHGFERSSSSDVDRQAKLFQWAREIAKEYAPVITVHQADGTAENTMWIEMDRLYGSKTAIQGEADAIITLGRSSELPANTRGLYIPKNKFSSPVEEARNIKAEVIIEPTIARVVSPKE